MFRIIDKDTWKRKPYFDHYFNQILCTYSITVNIDISEIIAFKNKNNTKLYPLLIYILTKAVNNHEEFRTAINDKGELGVWDTLLPCYTVFHEENETFSNLWTEWNDNLMAFLSNYKRDIEMFGNNYGIDEYICRRELSVAYFYLWKIFSARWQISYSPFRSGSPCCM